MLRILDTVSVIPKTKMDVHRGMVRAREGGKEGDKWKKEWEKGISIMSEMLFNMLLFWEVGL